MECDWALWPKETYRALILDAVFRSGLWAALTRGVTLGELYREGFSEPWLVRLWPLLQRWGWIRVDSEQRWWWSASEDLAQVLVMMEQLREWLTLAVRLSPTRCQEDEDLLRAIGEQVRAMKTAPHVVPLLFRAVGDVRGQRWLDVGSGPGTIGAALAQRGAEVTLFDRPMVAALWEGALSGLTHYVGGDALERWPSGSYDGVALVRFIENFPPPTVQILLARCAQSLKPGGRLVILGYLDGSSELWHLFGVQVGVHSADGMSYTPEHLAELALGTSLRSPAPPMYDRESGYTALVFEKGGVGDPPHHGCSQSGSPRQHHDGQEPLEAGASHRQHHHDV